MKTYLVGGAVRDQLLGLPPKDSDYVIVGATQADVEAMLSKGFMQVGADFPVFLHPETGDEYALARIERKSGAGYHGFTVQADEHVTLEDDLARRDLTINSMAIELDGALVDPYGGMADLHNHVLRHTSAAFSEDPLRVLRLARFAARFLNFTVAPETVQLCNELCKTGELNELSVERVWAELEKGFNEVSPKRFFKMLGELGAIEHCKILHEIFGSVTEQKLHTASLLASVGTDRRLTVSIAVLAEAASKLQGASSRVRECHLHANELFWLPKEAMAMVKFLKKCRAYSAGPGFEDVATTAMVLTGAGFKLPFSDRKLLTAKRVAMDLSAKDFPGFEGKALGDAIERGRAEAIAQCMTIPI